MRKGIWLGIAAFAILLSVAGVVPGGSDARAAGTKVAMVEGPGDPTTAWKFEPADITVAAGSTVAWHNSGEQPHTVTADDGSFDSDNVSPGGDFERTFATAGTFSYKCTPHPWMKAVVHVTGGATPASTTPPATSPPGSPATTTTTAPAKAAPSGQPTTTTTAKAGASSSTTTTAAATATTATTAATAATTPTTTAAVTPTSAPGSATTTTTAPSARANEEAAGTEGGGPGGGKNNTLGIVLAAILTAVLTGTAGKMLFS